MGLLWKLGRKISFLLSLMPLLAAVPTGSIVNPCCCDCHGTYGDTLDAVLSAFIACACVTRPGVSFLGSITSDFNGAATLHWNTDVIDRWVSNARIGEVQIQNFDVEFCGGAPVSTDTYDVWIQSVCVSPGDPASVLRTTVYLVPTGTGPLDPSSGIAIYEEPTPLDTPVSNRTFCGDPSAFPKIAEGTITISLP